MIHFDFGANSANFRLNKSALIPTTTTSMVGMRAIGVHNFIGINPQSGVDAAWMAWLTTVMTSLKAVSNKEVSFTMEDLSGYLQFCGYIETALAEAKRDLTMVNFGDVLSTSALRDYFGPSYQTVINDAIENGPAYWSRWNSLARHVAEQFPHMSMPYFDQFTYLLGRVFKDSDRGRWRYLYLHMWNGSFWMEGATQMAPWAYGALQSAENVVSGFENTVKANATTGLTQSKMDEIKALLLNAYGEACTQDYGTVIDYATMPTVVYDPDLITLLNNAVLAPTIVWGGATAAEFKSYASANAANVEYLANLATPNLKPTATVTFQTNSDMSQTDAATIYQGLALCAGMPVTLYGPKFDGAEGLWNVGLVESWDVTLGGSGDSSWYVSIAPNSPFGLTLGRWFSAAVTPTGVASWFVYHNGAARVGNSGGLYNTFAARINASIAYLNQFDFGNFINWDTVTMSYMTSAEPVDEFGVISKLTLTTYIDACVMGLFDSYRTKFRTTRTAEYAVVNNQAMVKSASQEARGHVRFEKRGKRTKDGGKYHGKGKQA